MVPNGQPGGRDRVWTERETGWGTVCFGDDELRAHLCRVEGVGGVVPRHEVVESYGSTEAGPILVDGRVRRPPVTDLKLADVPDLGYFHTDRPHPRWL
jgi:hypothetical protein